MNIIIPALLAFACFAVFYHFAVRRVLLDMVRFRLFALRDELRRRAIDDKIKPTSFCFQHLERSLCNLITLAPQLNMYHFGQFMIWRGTPKGAAQVSAREKRFESVADGESLAIERKAVEALFWVLLINSPIGASVVAIAFGFGALGVALNRKLIFMFGRLRLRLEGEGREFLEGGLMTA